mgnify:CR=1 FL=1
MLDENDVGLLVAAKSLGRQQRDTGDWDLQARLTEDLWRQEYN